MTQQTPDAETPPDTLALQFAGSIRECLDAQDADAALIAFMGEAGRPAANLPHSPGLYGSVRPHPLAGFAAMLIAGALIRKGRAAEVAPFWTDFAAPFVDSRLRYPNGARDLLAHFHFLYMPAIDAALTLNDQNGLVAMINETVRAPSPHAVKAALTDPLVADLLDHPKVPRVPPSCEPAWLLDRQEKMMALGPLDQRQERVREFEALFLKNALTSGQPARALPLIESRLGGYERDGFRDDEDFTFNAVCILAALGHLNEALIAARALARRGYEQQWRLRFDAADEWWMQAMRQSEWQAKLVATPVYQAFLREDIVHDPLSPSLSPEVPETNDPHVVPLCAVRDGAWNGKKKKRCFISGNFIQPGDPVVRLRRLLGKRATDDFDIAAKSAFEASGWQTAREQLETDRIPLSLLFAAPRRCRSNWDSPAVAVFQYDVAKGPHSVDIKRAVDLIADHAPPPIRHEWVKGDGSVNRVLAFEPWADDRGHGDAVNLAWRLIKAGYRNDVIRLTSNLPQKKADKVFAMLATFDDTTLRGAAAGHFDLPDLPAMMTLVFKGRLSLDDHLMLAQFADKHPRYRAALAEAMRAYALHLYSNVHPGADWFLQGLEHFSLAGGCALLFFLLHHPEEDDVLATMIEKQWLPNGCETGGFDAYRNSRPFYIRAAVFHLALDAPDRLDSWLAQEWMNRWYSWPKDRETFRLLKTLRARRK
jgi:hypothetical protein